MFIGWCQDINDAWEDKNVVIKMKGSYNGSYTIDDELEMKQFLDKTFIVVQGDLETTIGHIKKGLVIQNNSYMPIQKSLDQIAKTIVKVDKTLGTITDYLEEKDECSALEDTVNEPQNSEEVEDKKEFVETGD